MKTEEERINELRAVAIAATPASARGIVASAYERKSRARAIKAFCLTCVGFKRADVENCTAVCCPLFVWRPRFVGSGAPEGDEMIEEVSPYLDGDSSAPAGV